MAIRAAELNVLIGADTAGAEKGFQTVSDGLKKLAGAGGSSTFKDVFGGMLSSSLVTQLGAQIQSLGQDAIASFADYERLGLSLQSLVAREQLAAGGAKTMAEALQQSGGMAKELQGWVQKLAIESPFTQQGVADALRMSMAYGFTTKEAQRLTQAMIDFSSGSGASEATMSKVSLALGQIQARGHLAGQEVMQLTEAGINVDQILAKAFKRSTGEVIAMREKGLVPAKDAIDAIAASLEENFGGAAKRQAGTMSGLLSSLQDLKAVGLREFFGATFQEIQPELQKFVDAMQSKETLTAIRGWGKDLADGLKDAAGAARDTAVWFRDLDDANKNMLVGFGGLVAFRGPLLSMLGDLAGVASKGATAVEWMKVGYGPTVAMTEAFGVFGVAAGIVGVTLAAAAAALFLWNENVEKTNKLGLKGTGNAWADWAKDQTGSTQSVLANFAGANASWENSLRGSGGAALFVDETSIRKQAMEAIGPVLRRTTKSYQEYVNAMIDAGIASHRLTSDYAVVKNNAEKLAITMPFLITQVGMVTAEVYEQGKAYEAGTQSLGAYWDMMRNGDRSSSSSGMLAGFRQEFETTTAQFKMDVASAQGLADQYYTALAKIADAQGKVLAVSSNKVVTAISNRFYEGTDEWKKYMRMQDEVYGTSALKQWEYDQSLKKAINSGDIDAAKQALIDLRDTGLKGVLDQMGDVVTKTKEMYNQLLLLPSTIKIAIKFTMSGIPGWLYQGLPGYLSGVHVGENSGQALGGPVYPGKTYLVGERGPELFRPDVAGRIERSDQLSAASGQQEKTVIHNYRTFQITVHNEDGRMNESALAAAIKRMEWAYGG